MKKMFVALLVFALLATASMPAFAAGGSNGKGSGKANPPAASNLAGSRANQSGANHGQGKPPTSPNNKNKGPVGQNKQQKSPANSDDSAKTPPGQDKQAKSPKIPNPRAAFVIRGVVSSVNAISGTVTITVTHSNQIARWLLGGSTTITLTATDATRLLGATSNYSGTLTLAGLAAGQCLQAQGRVTQGVWDAQRILIDLNATEPDESVAVRP